jgi:hypothetical protein
MKQIPRGNDRKKGKGNSNSKGKGKYKYRGPSTTGCALRSG